LPVDLDFRARSFWHCRNVEIGIDEIET